MRYFCYNPAPGVVTTVSEEELRKTWWPLWYQTMCEKYEQAYVDETYCFEDSVDDWLISHKGWDVS